MISANTFTISSNSASCGAIRVWANSTGSSTVDLKVQSNSVYCNNQPGTGLLVIDSGGIVAQGNVFSYNCGVGTKLFPGASQAVVWSLFSGLWMRGAKTQSGAENDLRTHRRKLHNRVASRIAKAAA